MGQSKMTQIKALEINQSKKRVKNSTGKKMNLFQWRSMRLKMTVQRQNNKFWATSLRCLNQQTEAVILRSPQQTQKSILLNQRISQRVSQTPKKEEEATRQQRN